MQPQVQIFGTPGQVDVLAAGTGSVRVQISDTLVAELSTFITSYQATTLINQLLSQAVAALKSQISSQAVPALGNITESTSAVLTITGGTDAVVGNVTIQVTQSDSTHNGYLSSTDWSTFNGKLSDAPSDGTTYGRNTGAWVAAGGGADVLQVQVFS